MSVLIPAEYMICGICLTIGLLHLTLFLRCREHQADLFFALMGVIAAICALLEGTLLQTTDAGRFITIFKTQISFHGLLWIALIWFVHAYTGATRRWLVYAATGIYALAVVINMISPFGILFTAIDPLHVTVLPWGERLTFATGPANPWRVIADAGWFTMLYLTFESCVRLWRRNARQKAIILGLSLFACNGAAYLHGTLIDLGIVTPPPLLSFSFLAIIMVMSATLTNKVVRASVLSATVVANERRWQTLMQHVQLLVAEIDDNGRIRFINPYFVHMTGFQESDLIGQLFPHLLMKQDREQALQRYQHAMQGRAHPHSQSALTKKDGGTLTVAWSSVTLYDDGGQAMGMLSIGADVTQRLQAENARDRAIQELTELKTRLEAENLYLKEEINVDHGFDEIIGCSNPLLYVLSKVKQVAPTDSTVLIQGETGVGKELIARAIHQSSPRADTPFIRVNCAALPNELVESELFGYEKGAFTGANQRRKGRFELADGGTLLLDEIGEMPLEIQTKLLNVIQDRMIERIGGSQPIAVNVRIIAATNRNLRQAVAASQFRPDLFYRLSVFPITVPPLRGRPDDIPLLVQHFVTRFTKRMGKRMDQIPNRIMDQLLAYDWPGNVRELSNVIERAVITCPGPQLCLPSGFGVSSDPAFLPAKTDEQALLPLVEMERRHILAALNAVNWRISGPNGAAAILKINPSTLRHRINKHGLKKMDADRASSESA